MVMGESDYRQIKFDDRHVDAIMDGEKTVTVRYDCDHDFDRGDVVELVNQHSRSVTVAKIVTQFELRADWVAFADFEAHQQYTTTAELLDELERYYPDATIEPGTVLDVIVFETDLIVLSLLEFEAIIEGSLDRCVLQWWSGEITAGFPRPPLGTSIVADQSEFNVIALIKRVDSRSCIPHNR